MTSAHRYPPPPPSSQNDFRLPSLKDLNFYRPSGAQPAPQQQDPASTQAEQPPQPSRHPAAWSRSAYQPPQPPAPATHQQYTQPSHEVVPKVEYPPKHENTGYAHPGLPLSVQTNSAPSSATMPPTRSDGAPHSPNQQKRQRTAPASRDTRKSHPTGYPHPQYPPGPQPSAGQYHPGPSGLPSTPSHATHSAPSSHEQIHHPSHPMPVTAHSGYAYPAYVQPRQTLLHPPNSSQISQHNHSNPYSSPAPPPAHAPPPQGHWTQSQQSPLHIQQQHPPPTQHPQHNPHPVHAPSNHHHQQQQQQQQPQASIPASSNQPVLPHHHQQAPPPPPPPAAPPSNPPPSQQISPSLQYHPHQQQYQNQYPHASQPQQQQQTTTSFVRPNVINPTRLENRSTYSVAEHPRVPSAQNDAMSEITDHCNILYSFANQYVALQQANPHAQPPPAELQEMSQRALKVVRLLDDFRRICIPETQLQTSPTASGLASNSVTPMQADSPGPGESSRPPKRPWEDTQEEGVSASDAVGFQEFPANPDPDSKTPSTAEQDMELIRTKRATSTATANGSSGQPKSKYRKRSMGQRASPPGKCHSCNIRETPEWRRGPDGARTLCNACGLHYAKLMRKQNKTAGNGDAPHIDLETLRASTRAADTSEKPRNSSSKQAESSSSKTNNKNQSNSSDTNAEGSTSGRPGTAPPAPSQTAHQGSFQLVSVMAPQDHHPGQGQSHPPVPSSSTPMQVDSRPTSQHASTPQMQAMHPPPPPSGAPPHHSHPHPQHPPHPPWPTTAATTGAAAAASGAVSATSGPSARGGGSGGSAGGPAISFGNPPSQSPSDFIRRQYSMPNRPGNQQHQSASR